MSLSPRDEENPDQIFQYRRAWAAINTMLENGRSLSGRERHCAFLNTRGTRFADVSAASGLDLLDDGRGVALTDWNHDGLVDVWTTNRTGPWVRLLENKSRTRHRFLSLKLQGTRCNRDAIGARLELHLGGQDERVLYKSLRAGEGFVSQSSKRILFGLGNAEQIEKLVIRWPGGDVQEIEGLVADKHYEIVQGQANAVAWQPPVPNDLPAAPVLTNPGAASRIVLVNRVPLPDLRFTPPGESSREVSADGKKPMLINLWASWCGPCLHELHEWKRDAEQLNETVVCASRSMASPMCIFGK